jgi:hypothetical protein
MTVSSLIFLFQEVDMTEAPLSIQEIRENVTDFTIGFFFDISVILMKKPDPRETQWKRLIEPLRWEVMVLAGCLVPVVSIILFSMERVNPFYKAKCDRVSLYDTFWYAYGCVFMQGIIFKFRHTSMFTSLLTTCFFEIYIFK